MFKYFLKFVFGVYNLIKENKTIEIIEIAENNLEDSKSDKNMKIAEDEEIKCKLAGNEILYPCEKLLTIFCCVIPVILINKVFWIKDYRIDFYMSA